MTFLSSLWLWAAAAALVPLIIHLLSRGRGRVIPVGTTRFLPRSRSHRLRRFRPSGLLRLLLRVALLAALASALAAPRWWRAPAPRPEETWALVDPALLEARSRLEASSPEVFARLDRIAATRRLLLMPGLPEWEGGTRAPVVPPANAGAPSRDLWSLVSEAAARTPPEARLEIFVLDRAQALRGLRPDLGRPFEWWSVADPEPNRWIQRAVRSEAGTTVTVGESDASGTRFATRIVPSLDPNADLSLSQTPEGVLLELREGGSRDGDDRTIVRQLPPLRASVRSTPERSADRAAVVQALESVAAHLGRPLVIADGSTATTDLTVELGETTPATSAVAAALRLRDWPDGGRPCREAVFVAALPDPWLDLRRCPETVGSVPGYWPDARGDALLSIEPKAIAGSGTAYRWNGRFDPAWSSVTESALPHLLLGLLEPGDEALGGAGGPESDRRAAATGQGRPRHSAAASAAEPSPVPDPLPERMAWIAVALLFLSDRLLVGRSR